MFRILRRSKRSEGTPVGRLPDDLRIYAIGDVHGRIDLLRSMFSRIHEDAAARPPSMRCEIIMLGDLIDRGMESRAVLEFLLDPDLPDGFHLTVLMGNHERCLLDVLETGKGLAGWLELGGAATIASYGCAPPLGRMSRGDLERLRLDLLANVPERHRIFLSNCPIFQIRGSYFFVHAGINPKRSLEAQRQADLLWIRAPFLTYTGPLEKIVVHGHHITETPEATPNRIGVDTGAYATGVLSAVVLEGSERRFLQVGRR